MTTAPTAGRLVASIRERGDTVAVLYRLGKKQTSTTFTNLAAAEDFKSLCDILGPERAVAELAARQQVGITLDDLAARFFEWKAGDVEPRTLKDYRRDYDNHIRPHLGTRQAEAIDELDVQGLVDKLARTLDPKTVADRHAILAGIYKYGSAKVRQLVTHNPCLETQLPKRKKKAVKGFSLPEWDAMHAWAAEHEPDADDLLLFLVSTGWRISECTALQVGGVEDYGDTEVTVDGRVVVVPLVHVTVRGVHRRDDQDRIVYAEGKAKSSAGLRRINLPADAARVVRRRMVGKAPGDLLFTNAQGNQWRTTNLLEREFARILDGAGIAKVHGMGLHYFRHTQVAMLDRAKVSLAKTQRRIGHENITTTIGVYGGMIDNSLEPEELVRLNAMIVHPAAATEVVAGEVVVGELSPAGTASTPE
jgi:integrase